MRQASDALRGVSVLCPGGPGKIVATILDSENDGMRVESHIIILDKDAREGFDFRMQTYLAADVKPLLN